MTEERAAVLDQIHDYPIYGQFSERRGLIEIAEDLSAYNPQIIDALLEWSTTVRFIQSTLYRISAFDPLTLPAAIARLSAAAFIAAFLPARRRR